MQSGIAGNDKAMTPADRAELERRARCLAHPILIGREADRAVAAIVAWTETNPEVTGQRRERAWERIVQMVC